MSESKHAAVPWRVSSTGYSIKSDAADMPIVATNPWGSAMREADAPAWLANAQFIVRAVNAHEDMLNALRGLVAATERGNMNADEYDAAEAALAKADGRHE